MKRFALFLLLALTLALPARAQDDDRGYLQGLLEDALSDAGREVRLVGFEGALSSRASIAEMTIADDTGIWLTARNVVLDWNRSALLRGRLEIAAFTAEELLIPRAPAPQAEPADTGEAGIAIPDLPTPEATGFALPDLPVSVDIAQLKIDRIEIGAPLLGNDAVLTAQGSANLSGGEGQADLKISRIDARRGHFALKGGYSNATRELALALTLDEAADGIVTTLIGLPGAPPLALRIEGTGPIDDYAARAVLSTDGQERLTGDFTLQGKAFSADLDGDLRPLLAADYRPFFGPQMQLALAGQQPEGGGLELDQLTLTTQAVSLTGDLSLAPDGWPTRFDLNGQVAAQDGSDVLLPLSGPRTYLSSATLALAFDAAKGDTWTAAMNIRDLRQAGNAFDRLALEGTGQIQPGATAAGGAFDLSARGIALADTALAQAVGGTLDGRVLFTLVSGAPLELTQIILTAGDTSLKGALTIGAELSGAAAVQADDLSRFAALAGQPLSGAATLTVNGAATPLEGLFDLLITGTTQDVAIGQPQLDPLLAGQGALTATIRRDATGVHIPNARFATPRAHVETIADLKTKGSTARLEARIEDAAVIAKALSGPATVHVDMADLGPNWAVKAQATGPGGANAALDGTATILDGVLDLLSGTLTLRADTLTPYSALAGQSLGGTLDLTAEGQAKLTDGSGSADIVLSADNLKTGIPDVDRLLAGRSSFDGSVARDATGNISLSKAKFRSPELSADATGNVSEAQSALSYSAQLNNIGLFVDGLVGPVTAEGTAQSTSGDWQVNTQATGPGGTTATVKGSIAPDASRADLTAVGKAPVALANRFITPNIATGLLDIDLALNGPLALQSLNGTVATTGARLSVPDLKIAFDQIAARANFGNGQVRLETNSKVSTGGQLSVSGPVSLSAPYAGDLAVQLRNFGVTDPGLYETKVNGTMAVQGPLAGGATISGALELGQVEVRVPDGFGASGASLPGLEHRNEPAAVHQTRARAGAIETADDGGSGSSGPAYPLDLRISAPARIFVRGRGLDAELGGALALRGTSANVIPQGRFDLIRGRLDILGKRLTLTEGAIQMEGSFDPYLRIVAETTSDDTTITITVEGPVGAPEVSITSSPELPEDEILARLLFGRDITQISAVQALQLAAAINTLAGGGSGMTDRLRDTFGLDDLNVTTDTEGNTGVSVGKYLSENIYSDVTATSDGQTEINLNLQISPSLTARGTVGSDGTSGLGIYFEKDY